MVQSVFQVITQLRFENGNWGRFRPDPGDDEFVHTILVHVDGLEPEVVTDESIFELWHAP